MIIRSDEAEDVLVPGSGTMRMHLFRPAVPGRFPGVLFFSEIYQVTDPIRRLAAMVAGQGYLVGGARGLSRVRARRHGAALRPARHRSRQRAQDPPSRSPPSMPTRGAGLAFLRQHAACTGRLATLGVCLGGHLAYRAALDPSVSAAACFYATDIHSGTLGAGRADDSLARMADLKAETLFVWGRQDPHVPFAGRQAIRARLEEVGARYEWHEVNAAHAFLRDEGPRYDPALFLQAMAWMLALFRRTLTTVE